MKRFQCYSAQKSLLGGGGNAIIASSSRSRSLSRFEIDLGPGPELDNLETYTYLASQFKIVKCHVGKSFGILHYKINIQLILLTCNLEENFRNLVYTFSD